MNQGFKSIFHIRLETNFCVHCLKIIRDAMGIPQEAIGATEETSNRLAIPGEAMDDDDDDTTGIIPSPRVMGAEPTAVSPSCTLKMAHMFSFLVVVTI
jgi:hypothetical protein